MKAQSLEMAAKRCHGARQYAESRQHRSTSRERENRECRPYRKHTEALLHRYTKVSTNRGRCPCVLGNLVFRGKSSYSSMRSFEDDMIFVHDMETCLKKLDAGGQELVARIAIQQYTQSEAAQMLGTSVRSTMRRYEETLDRLTDLLYDADMIKMHAW